jgi:hypothetical protein
MLSGERKFCCSMIKILFIELCNTCIAPEMFFVAIHTRTGCIVKVIPVLVQDSFANFGMTVDAFFSGNLLALFMALSAVIDSLQFFVSLREFTRRDLSGSDLKDHANQNERYKKTKQHLEDPGIAKPQCYTNVGGKSNKHYRCKRQMDRVPVIEKFFNLEQKKGFLYERRPR